MLWSSSGTYILTEEKVELSFYIKKQTSNSDPEALILYSTKTSSTIIIPKDLLESIEKKRITPEEKQTLKELGFLVQSRQKERDEIIHLFDNIKNPYLNILLVLNMDCNFSCKYCFEGSSKTGLYMSKHILNKSMEFIKDELYKKKASELRLALYGGEPLLSPELAIESLKKAKTLCENIGINFRASIITNGSLFKKKIVKELSQLGLARARITLDGPPEIHNIFRPFKNGRPSFDIILKNIKESLGIIKALEINGNYSKENYTQFPKLLDLLLKEGITPDKVESIRFEPIIKQTSGMSLYKGGCLSINEPWVAETSLFLREEIMKRGYKTKRIEPIFCLINNKNAFIINIDGALYKCPGFLGIKEFQIGDIFSGSKEPLVYHPNRWKNEKCSSCIYLPLCYGGCRYMSYLRYGDLYRLDCQKPFLDQYLDRFIEQDIRYKGIG